MFRILKIVQILEKCSNLQDVQIMKNIFKNYSKLKKCSNFSMKKCSELKVPNFKNVHIKKLSRFEKCSKKL
jgi:hypothetical protein